MRSSDGETGFEDLVERGCIEFIDTEEEGVLVGVDREDFTEDHTHLEIDPQLLRIGTMERDAFVGHGAAMALKDRLLDESDRELVNVCDNCGMTAIENIEQNRVYCLNCEEETPIHEIETSYAFKLLLDEMIALGIRPRLNIDDVV